MDASRIITLAESHAATDYGSRQSVLRANAAADEMRSIMLAALQSADSREDILALLSHPAAASWVAFTALESSLLTELQRARCLQVIKALAGGDTPGSLGAKGWLVQHGYAG